jgi:hypothetical protein
MRPIFHTRPAAAVPLWLAIATVAGACASKPIYEFEPTDAPLRYSLSSKGGNDIETPGGMQSASFGSEASLSLSFGKATDEGTPFTVTIDSIVLKTGGDFGGSTTDLTGEVKGKPFRGTMAWDGSVTFTEYPEFTSSNLSGSDMKRVASALLFPLPPGGDLAVAEWAHNVTLPMGGGLEGESVYSGLMSVAGDTVWGGVNAKVLVSEGVIEMEGSGQPQGAPAEIDLLNEVDARTVYIWDPGRGVLLAAAGSGKGRGDISTMGFSMPMSSHSSVEIHLWGASDDMGDAGEKAPAKPEPEAAEAAPADSSGT